ncbi:glycosyltransferase [Sebaldella sp. S0638]|uniref:glycosyltransferase n=1 Tax=Sebaldella sp. S0638 TaxID=2957809 RepID=UPI00209E048E|nr:glycosyltransferase [Sebaldella sp. S0638]MCP1223128.1 glycosyl transferase [Sebaldella sp. S0638]
MGKKIKVDFLAPPFEGHLNPLIEMAEKLKGKYDIRFITGKNKNEILKNSGFQVENILTEENEVFERLSDTDKQVKINFFELKKQFSENLRLIPKVTDELKKLMRENKTDIMVADFIVVSSVFCSQDIGIPFITTMPTSFAPENKDGTPAYFGGLSPVDSVYGKVRDYIARKQIRLFKKTIYYLFYKQIKKMNFTLYNKNDEENFYSPYSILGLGMKEFEYKRSWPEQYQFAGACCETPSYYTNRVQTGKIADIFEKKNKYKRKVLVSLGTHLKWAKKTLAESIEKIAENFQDTLFVVTMGKKDSDGEIAAEERTGNVVITDYLSYTDYFHRFDYVIHHGGAGITYNCIKYKKPSLVIPQDYDQFDFAARIEYFKTGFRAKNINNIKDVTKKLNILFNKEKWAELEQLSEDFTGYSPHELLDSEIERLILEYGGGRK